MSELPQFSCHFCKRALWKLGSFAKETWKYRKPIQQAYPFPLSLALALSLFLFLSLSPPPSFSVFVSLSCSRVLSLSLSLALCLFLTITLCISGSRFSIMRWLRLVGYLKTQVSFAKEPYKQDNILQKRPIFQRSLLIIATSLHSIPHTHTHIHTHTHTHTPEDIDSTANPTWDDIFESSKLQARMALFTEM